MKSPRVNPIRKRKVKFLLKQGIDAKNAMIEAGYAERTAHNATSKRVVKDCQMEIAEEFSKSEWTIDRMLTEVIELGRRAEGDKSYGTAMQGLTLASKLLGLLKDNELQIGIQLNVSDLYRQVITNEDTEAFEGE